MFISFSPCCFEVLNGHGFPGTSATGPVHCFSLELPTQGNLPCLQRQVPPSRSQGSFQTASIFSLCCAKFLQLLCSFSFSCRYLPILGDLLLFSSPNCYFPSIWSPGPGEAAFFLLIASLSFVTLASLTCTINSFKTSHHYVFHS